MFRSHQIPAPQRLIDRGHQHGIMIRTVADAVAFLKRQNTRPIAGLARLGTGAALNRGRQFDDIAAERRFHEQRVARRAKRIAANIMRQPNPLLYVITRPYTADLVKAIWDQAHWLISQHVAERLCAAWPYRVPYCYAYRSAWLDVSIQDVPASAASIYIPGRKWRGDMGNARVTISRRTVIQLWPNLIVDGAVVADIVPLAEGAYRATWLQQGRGNTVKVVHGFIIDEVRIAADDLQTARKMATANKAKPATVP